MAYIHDIRKKVGHMPLIMTSASGVLFDSQHRVLLQARADTGNWGFPGGYLEYGESFKTAVVREYKEDAGRLVKPVKLLGILDQDFYTYPNGDEVQPVNAVYVVEAVSDQLFETKASETVQTTFVALDQDPKFFNGQHEKMWQLARNYAHQRWGRTIHN